MNFRAVLTIVFVVSQSAAKLRAESLQWSSDAYAINLDASQAPMDGGFEFQLGVFSNGFEPTAANAASWSQFWNPAQTTFYNTNFKRFAGVYQDFNNPTPFVEGAKGWIFGRRNGSTGSDWILFRADDWLWPVLDLMNPFNISWNAKDANQVVVGTIHAGGAPFLMKSALVRSYAQWQTAELSGEPLNAPVDDPDRDGISNLLEFVFATAPKVANAPVATPVDLQSGHAVITVPRVIGHLAKCTVEVSGNLVDWQSGPTHTEVLQDDATALVVRDLTPLSPANPKRFIRFKATLP